MSGDSDQCQRPAHWTGLPRANWLVAQTHGLGRERGPFSPPQRHSDPWLPYSTPCDPVTLICCSPSDLVGGCWVCLSRRWSSQRVALTHRVRLVEREAMLCIVRGLPEGDGATRLATLRTRSGRPSPRHSEISATSSFSTVRKCPAHWL